MSQVALDTNLLTLLVVGRTSSTLIEKHKRLKAYDQRAFRILLEILGQAEELVVTTNTMTEAGNLIGFGIVEPLRSRLYSSLQEISARSREIAIPSIQACAAPEYLRIGLTDAAWLSALDSETVLLTDDIDLYFATSKRGFHVIKFEHLRKSSSALAVR